MASFKRLKRSDVISVPYVANKNWVFEYCPYPENDQYIKIYKGTNLSGSFSTYLDPITEGQYERLIYSQINHLFYQKYSSSIELLNTSSLLSSAYYDGISENRATGSYFDYNNNPNLIKNFPTGANAGIRVLSINQDLYGQRMLPYYFEISSSVYYVKDDGIGNLIDLKNANVHIGNIFYTQGMAIITHQDYQLMWPLPPLAKYKRVVFFDTDSNKTVDLSDSIDGRGNTVDLSTLSVSGPYAHLCSVNASGFLTLNATVPGNYIIDFTFNATVPNSQCSDTNLISNKGILEIIIRGNCGFNVNVVENPTATPTATPTTTPTSTPLITPTPTNTPTQTPTGTIPGATPTATPTSTTTNTATPTATPTGTIPPTPTATPTATPVCINFKINNISIYPDTVQYNSCLGGYTTILVNPGEEINICANLTSLYPSDFEGHLLITYLGSVCI
jgi:hypothetical protein